MRYLSASLLLTLCWCLSSGCDLGKTARLEAENVSLREQLKNSNLRLQAECSSAAKAWVAEHLARTSDDMVSTHRNHYNAKLNKCFVLANKMSSHGSTPGGVSTRFVLADVFDNAQPGWLFYSTNHAGTTVNDCYVGETKCNSEEAFKQLVEPFLSE